MRLKPATDIINPFPGLRPFLAEESNMFFGREGETGEILKKLLNNRILTVIGASGSGKTSLINCGVVPEMIKLAEKDNYLLKIITFQPGNDPIANMSIAFEKAASENNNSLNVDKLFFSNRDRDQEWIASMTNKLLINSGEKVLIIVDQFEELFTYSPKGEGISRIENTSEFVTLIEHAIKQTAIEIYIVIIIRSDYLGECANIRGLTYLINSSNYLLPKMTPANFKGVFENSFISAGTRINSDLVQTVLDDISNQTDQLAVLQHVMMRTYSYWYSLGNTGRPVDLSDYFAVGTIRDAILKHAEEGYEELNQKEKEICRKMFRAMNGYRIFDREIKHPLKISSLKSIIQCSYDDLFAVIEKFRTSSRSFLTPGYNISLDENSFIDFSTESFIRLWNRLKGWVDEELASARIYMQLSETSEMYQRGKATLLKDADLQQAIRWRENQKPTLSWAKMYDPAFERVMVYIRTSEKAHLEKEKNKIRENKRKINRNRITAFILGFLVILSLGLMLFAFIQKNTSDRQKSEAERQKTMAMAQATIAEQSTLNAVKKLAISDSSAAVASRKEKEARQLIEVYNSQISVVERNAAEARKQLSIAKEESDLSGQKTITAIEQKNEALRLRMISLGKSMALKSLQLTGQKDLQSLLAYQAYIFNKSNGGATNDDDIFNGLYNVARMNGNSYRKTFAGYEGEIKNIAFIPGNNEFFTSGSDGKVLKWDLDGKNQNFQVIYSGSEIINVIAVSPDASWLACGGENSGIKMVPLKGNDISFDLKGHTGSIKSLIFSYDGRYLYSASLDGKVLKWDLTARNSTNISGNMMQVNTIDLSSDNKYIAGLSNEGKVIVWNPEVASDNFRIESPGKVIRTMKFKPDENLLAIGYSDGYIDIWDISARKKVSEIKAHDSEVTSIRFNKKLSQMATAGNDKSIRLWDMSAPSNLPVIFNDNEGLVFTIEFSPDGQTLVSATSGVNSLMSRPTLADLLGKDLCSTIARNLTVEEWQAYVGKDIDYEKTCPETDFRIKVNVVK